MVSWKHLVMFLPLALFVAAAIGNPDMFPRKCAQCVSGNFLLRRELFQTRDGAHVMGWMADWMGTDCVAEKKVRILPCKHACVTILLEKKIKNNADYIYDGLMMDCADQLIWRTSDFPEHIDPLAIKENRTFVASRGHYNISYYFTTLDTKAADIFDQIPHHDVYKLSSATSKLSRFFTYVFYLSPLICILLACCFVMKQSLRERNWQRAEANRRERALENQIRTVQKALQEATEMKNTRQEEQIVASSQDVEAQIEQPPMLQTAE